MRNESRKSGSGRGGKKPVAEKRYGACRLLLHLVQTKAEPIGTTVDAIRKALIWLGDCKREQAGHSLHLIFRYAPEADTSTPLKLKVEINTREHLCLLGLKHYPFAVENRWYQGKTEIISLEPEELFGTKLRALLQRRKNRDLFDLYEGLKQSHLNRDKILSCFTHYLELEGTTIHRAAAEERMLHKLERSLTEDIEPLLPAGVHFDQQEALRAFSLVWNELIIHIQGEAWKLSAKTIDKLRRTRFPDLLLES
jgi:Nucleotidyl transferase AbiEii toxin, Type IV TA system